MTDHPHGHPEDEAPEGRGKRLWILAGIVGVVAITKFVLALPELRANRITANESAAIATLKNISSAQSQCQASGVIDVNRNGTGEYGFFGELAVAVASRSGAPIGPPALSRAFGDVAGGRVERAGYVFQMFLPDREQRGVAEDAAGGDPGNDNGVDPDHAETLWCCYAWPQRQGKSGRRAYFVNQAGDVLASIGEAVAYDGARRSCEFHAAFCGGRERSMAAPVAANTVAQDGNMWVYVG